MFESENIDRDNVLYYIEDLVNFQMYSVKDGNGNEFLVYGETEAYRLAHSLNDLALIRDELTTKPDTTLDDIRYILGLSS